MKKHGFRSLYGNTKVVQNEVKLEVKITKPKKAGRPKKVK